MTKFIFKDTGKEIKVGDTFFIIAKESYRDDRVEREREIVREYVAKSVGRKLLKTDSYYQLHIEYNHNDFNNIFSSKESCELAIQIRLLCGRIRDSIHKIKELSNDDIFAIAKMLKIIENNL